MKTRPNFFADDNRSYLRNGLSRLKRIVAGLLVALQVASPIAASAAQYIQMVPVRDLKVVNGNALGSSFSTTNTNVTTAIAGNAVLKATPSSVSFGSLNVGQTSALQTITFANLGSAAATLGTLSTNKQFSVSNDCNGVTMPSLSTCQIRVGFNPTQVAAGGLLGTLVVPFTAGTASSQALIGMTGVSLMPLTNVQGTTVAGFTGTDPAMSVSANGVPQIAFGDTLATPGISATGGASGAAGAAGSVGASVTKTFTISSSGDAPVTFSGATITGDPAYTVTTTCPSIIPVGQSCTVSVTFNPTTAGTKTAVLTVDTSSFAGNTLSVNLQGQGVSTSRFSLSASALPFGNVTVGQSASRTLSVLNTGNEPLVHPVVATTSAYLSATHNCPTTLNAGSSCDVNVVFAPASPSALNGQVQVTFDTAGTLSASATGEGMGPMLSVDAASTNFGTVVTGQTASHIYTLSNDGNAPAPLTFSSLNGSVTLAGDCPVAPATLAAGAVCHAALTYAPNAVGTLSGSFTIASTLNSLALSYTGNAIAQPSFSTSTATVDFGNMLVGAASTLAVRILNDGTSTLGAPSVWLDGTDFTQTNNCATGVAVGQSCTVNLSFAPSVRKSYSSNLHVSFPYATTKTVALNATAQGAALAADFPSQSFGAVNINETGTVAYVLTNSGEVSAPLTFGALPVMVTRTGTCGASLAPGSNCTVYLTYAPTDTSTLTGALSVSSPTSSTTLSFTGMGVATIKFDVSATNLSFGTVTRGSSATSSFTVYNGGSTPLMNPVASTTGAGYSAVHNCTATLYSGYSCQVSVTYAPTDSLLQTGTASIQFDNANTKSVNLSGTGLDPNTLKFGATQLNVGNVAVGSIGSTSLAVMNQGVTSLAAPTISTSGAGFTATQNCPTVVAPNSSCTITVRFQPNSMGDATGTLSINSSGTITAVSLNGRATSLSGSMSARSISFGNVTVGVASATQSVVLSNSGNLDLAVSSVTSSGDFYAAHNCPSVLPVGGSCAINVSLTPSLIGFESGSVQVTTAAGQYSVTLTGTSYGATVAYLDIAGNALSNLVFAQTTVGSTSPLQTVVVKNTGNANLVFTGSGATLPTAFALAGTNSCASATVAPSATCSLQIAFSPTAMAAYSGQMAITSNGYATGAISLTGSGLGVQILQVVTSPKSNFSYIQKSDGTWSATGLNTAGQLGLGDTVNRNTFTVVPELTGATQVVLGTAHAIAKMADGSWMGTGSNSQGQLGAGTSAGNTKFASLPSFSGATEVVTGRLNTFAHFADNSWSATGINNFGELGLGDTTTRKTLTSVPSLAGATSVLTSSYSTYAHLANGSWAATGDNSYGQLGLGDSTRRTSFITVPSLAGATRMVVGDYSPFAQLADGSWVAAGANNPVYGSGATGGTDSNTFRTVAALAGATQIVAGGNTAFAKYPDGTWKATGYNLYGQLGRGNTSTPSLFDAIPSLTGATQVVAGGTHTFAKLSNGTWAGTGYGGYGALGLGTTANTLSFTAVPYLN